MFSVLLLTIHHCIAFIDAIMHLCVQTKNINDNPEVHDRVETVVYGRTPASCDSSSPTSNDGTEVAASRSDRRSRAERADRRESTDNLSRLSRESSYRLAVWYVIDVSPAAHRTVCLRIFNIPSSFTIPAVKIYVNLQSFQCNSKSAVYQPIQLLS